MNDNNIFYSIDEIAKITGGYWKNIENKTFRIENFIHIINHLEKDDLFIFHYKNWYNKKSSNESYIEKVISNGASSIMVQEETNINIDIPMLIVEDTYYALRNLALYASKISKAKKVLVTGSYGKTAFKLHLYELIKNQTNTYARLNSANKVVSTYTNLASLKKNTEVLVIEIPVNTGVKTRRRAGYVNPDICILTSIGHEHIERHGNIETIVKRKCSIASSLGINGKVIIPKDDAYYSLIRSELENYEDINILTFGSDSSCNAEIINSYFNNFGWDVLARIEDKILEYHVPFIEIHAPLSSLSELLCIYHLGLDIYKSAEKYAQCTNFKSSGTFHKLEFNQKKFFLYDQSRRGGIEGYMSFFKTIKNLTPSSGSKKIVITSEFVDIPDGETKYIDIKLFNELIRSSKIDEIYTVENFKEHQDVIVDKNKWKEHFDNVNDLQRNFFDMINDGDIICIKSIFESSMPKLSNYILKNSINDDIKSKVHNNKILKDMKIISSNDIDLFNSYISKSNKINWVHFFPFLYAFSNSKNKKILFSYENDSLIIYLLRHLNKNSKPFLQIFSVPIPFNKSLLLKSLNNVKSFNKVSKTTILWCDREDIHKIKECEEFKRGIQFKYKDNEFIFKPLNYDNLAGGKFRSLRQQIGWINKLDNVKILKYNSSFYNDCIEVYDLWKINQKSKSNAILDESYTKMCLLKFDEFSNENLDGIIITVNEKVKSFGFYGKINNKIGNLFVAKSDHSIKGLHLFLKYQMLLNMKDVALVNDGEGINKGLFESKKKLNPFSFLKIYKAQINLSKLAYESYYKLLRDRKEDEFLLSRNSSSCSLEIEELNKLINSITEKRPDFEKYFLPLLLKIKDITIKEDLESEKIIYELFMELRDIWISIAHIYSKKPMKSPLFNEKTQMPFSGSIRYDYERALVASKLENNYTKNVKDTTKWEVETSFFSSGMAAMNAVLKTLPIILKKQKVTSVNTDNLVGYFESDWLIYLFKIFNFYKLSYPKVSDIYERIANSKNDICIIENVIIDYEQTVINPVKLVNSILSRDKDKPFILIIDTSLISEFYNMSELINELPSNRPILLIEVCSGLKFNEEGLELSNVGYVRVYNTSLNNYFISAGYIKKKLHYVRDLLGTGLSINQLAILDIPWFSDKSMIKKHVSLVFDNNRELALSLSKIKHNNFISKISHPSLSSENKFKWAESPFVFLYLNENINTQKDRDFLISIIIYEVGQRNINFHWGSSFGFRHHRFEILRNYEYKDSQGNNLYFLRICMGRFNGPSVREIIILLKYILSFTSFDDLKIKYKNIKQIKKLK